MSATKTLCGCQLNGDDFKPCSEHAREVECNADADHPCDARDGDPCASCQAEHNYWAREWERYGRREVANRYTEDEIRDAYSDPTESAKRDILLNAG